MSGDLTEENFFTKWCLALRPFSFPASITPVILGTVASVAVGGASFNIFHFLLALIGMLALHGASNLLNDVYDFKLGLDTKVFPVSGAVVRKLISLEAALKASILLYLFGGLIGIFLALNSTLHLLWIGLLGLFIGIGYSYVRIGLKYRALGDFCVFLDFGILGTLGAWTLQSHSPSWIPVLWSVPIGLHIIAILHANNWRDIQSDGKKGSVSIAAILGDKGSFYYYGFLIFMPYILVVLYIFVPDFDGSGVRLPLGSLATFLSLPLAIKLLAKASQRGAPRNELDFVALDGSTARLNLLFGGLLILGFVMFFF
ncbi:MAG: prenyltransferase [SAR324 cluster bacterium]|uniref:Prenyltransferase n=1 Tax=SAR324 cluster bacterium TaxID=2024889 RepID=A0A7X9FU65_9DELT|nr:prenyltransferase [SAR324 cluster bacterium]